MAKTTACVQSNYILWHEAWMSCQQRWPLILDVKYSFFLLLPTSVRWQRHPLLERINRTRKQRFFRDACFVSCLFFAQTKDLPVQCCQFVKQKPKCSWKTLGTLSNRVLIPSYDTFMVSKPHVNELNWSKCQPANWRIAGSSDVEEAVLHYQNGNYEWPLNEIKMVHTMPSSPAAATWSTQDGILELRWTSE